MSPSFLLAQVIFEPNFSRTNNPTFSKLVILHAYLPMKMEQTECSETLAYKIQTPVNYPDDNYSSCQEISCLLWNSKVFLSCSQSGSA